MNITTEPIRNKKQLHAILGYLKENSSSRRKARLRNFVIAKTQLNTSLRISDVLPLKVSDIMHLSGNFRRYINLKEDKTGHKQRIAINDPLKVTLRMYIKEMGLEYDDFLFPGQSPK
ncbi:MAG: tyrosine-type recombinase/integrase [Veillonella parvula]